MSDPVAYMSARLSTLLPGRPVEDLVRAVQRPMLRRELTRDDPTLFMLLYLRHHARSDETGGRLSLSPFHEDLIQVAKTWMTPPTAPGEGRHAFVAPRGCGKSTWALLVLPLWAAAHGHAKFIAAFSDSATQAETHLSSVKQELDHNALLREDYPELCEPMLRPSGVKVSDNRSLIRQANGFSFAAKGLDGAILGLKVGNRRPDLILLDDVEPGESQYSAYQAKQRLVTIQDAVLPMNLNARVLLTGTVTMPGSIVHQLVRSVKGEGTEPWITDEKFVMHYWPAILTNDDGTERSVWPEKWPLSYLESVRHTRSFLKNFQNAPVPTESLYWTEDDIRYGQVPGVTRTVLSIDPAVTAKASSDETGLAVVGFSPSAISGRAGAPAGMCVVEHAEGVRLTPGEPLRAKVLQLLAAYPHITSVVIEGTQGQAAWHAVLHDLPVRLQIIQSGKASKAVRAGWALQRYQEGRVLHAGPLRRLEEQQIAFTGREGMADDICDAVNQAVLGFLPVQAQAPGLRLSVA